MSTETGRRISSAIAVRWTPALAGRVSRRIEHRLARRRRRRRASLVALALLGLAGVGFAFTHPWTRLPAGAPAAPASARAFAPPPSPTSPTSSPSSPELAPAASPEELPAAGHPSRPTQRAPHVPSGVLHRAQEETVPGLFAAADAARLAGRPADAVAPLTAIFTRHPRDPRAVVAAYQLGRVLAFDLHDRARAAVAFARAHDLDPGGPLAADAAAHAAETHAAEHATEETTK